MTNPTLKQKMDNLDEKYALRKQKYNDDYDNLQNYRNQVLRSLNKHRDLSFESFKLVNFTEAELQKASFIADQAFDELNHQIKADNQAIEDDWDDYKRQYHRTKTDLEEELKIKRSRSDEL